MTADFPPLRRHAALDYLGCLAALLGELIDTQEPNISAAADLLAPAIEEGGLVHVFGPGHSHIIAEEAFNRTGGLACINPIVDRTGGRAELVEGYAAAILEGHDLRQGEVMVVSSNCGVNPLPIEMALLARARGLAVVAITSLQFSRSLTARHTSGSHLFEVADVVLDNRCPEGDALVGVAGVKAGRARFFHRLDGSAQRDDRSHDRALRAPRGAMFLCCSVSAFPASSSTTTSSRAGTRTGSCPVHRHALRLTRLSRPRRPRCAISHLKRPEVREAHRDLPHRQDPIDLSTVWLMGLGGGAPEATADMAPSRLP